jgi:hypothetical protein
MDGEPVRNEYLISSQWSGTAPGSINYTGGNVGIGVAAPTAPMHVAYTAPTYTSVVDSTTGIGLKVSDGTGGIIWGPDMNHSIWLRAGQDGTLNTNNYYQYGAHRFYTGGVIQSQTLRLIIDSTGKVGIGTASPGTTLDINGTIRTSGQATNALILYFLSTCFTQQISYSAAADATLTFSATYIPAAARAVLADVFWSPGLVGGTTVDHQVMNLGSVSNGVQRTWTEGGWGSNPTSYLGTMNNQIVRILSDGENGTGTAYFMGLRGIWYASLTIPIAANGVLYYSNYGNSGSPGYLYFVVKGYYM